MADDTCDIRLATTDDELKTIVDLARIIWMDHYSPIIGVDQVNYMLGNFHSPAAIKDEIENGGFEYYIIASDGRDLGYFSYKTEDESLFLSKIYVLSAARGKGRAKRALAFLRDQARMHGLKTIRLTVNRNNTGSILAYERAGFQKTGEVKAEIGNGYVMDDYAMEWTF